MYFDIVINHKILSESKKFSVLYTFLSSCGFAWSNPVLVNRRTVVKIKVITNISLTYGYIVENIFLRSANVFAYTIYTYIKNVYQLYISTR